jgi:hypothetical protein
MPSIPLVGKFGKGVWGKTFSKVFLPDLSMVFILIFDILSHAFHVMTDGQMINRWHPERFRAFIH